MICLKGVAVAHTIHKVNRVGFRQRNNATLSPSRLMTAMTDDLPTNSAERASTAPIKLSQRHPESERQFWVASGQFSKKGRVGALINGARTRMQSRRQSPSQVGRSIRPPILMGIEPYLSSGLEGGLS
ncbi:hypothetical protein BGLA2_860026 [Burkholderia gladioli]|nr:hypothetical protein BGLA2_860026 [Burkholderia gladioli]